MTDRSNTDTTRKIRQLAEASLFYRNGVRQMIEEGMDQEELDQQVETAEEELIAEQQQKRQRVAKRQLVKKM